MATFHHELLMILLIISDTLLFATSESTHFFCPTYCDSDIVQHCFCYDVTLQSPRVGDWYGVSELKFQNNNISALGYDSFKNNSGLRSIEITHNPLKEIDFRIFKDLDRVGRITVTECDLERIVPLDKGQKIRSLLTLDLSQNKITTVPSNLLQGLANRKLSLKLSDNPLLIPGDQPFLVSDTLYFLDVCNTDGGGISSQTFTELPQLKTLFISNAGITDVSQKFTQLRRLLILALNDNPIKEIKEDFLQKKQKLMKIVIQNTPLENVEATAFEGKTKNAAISFASTPYGCQCKFQDILPYFDLVVDKCPEREGHCPFNNKRSVVSDFIDIYNTEANY